MQVFGYYVISYNNDSLIKATGQHNLCRSEAFVMDQGAVSRRSQRITGMKMETVNQ